MWLLPTPIKTANLNWKSTFSHMAISERHFQDKSQRKKVRNSLVNIYRFFSGSHIYQSLLGFRGIKSVHVFHFFFFFLANIILTNVEQRKIFFDFLFSLSSICLNNDAFSFSFSLFSMIKSHSYDPYLQWGLIAAQHCKDREAQHKPTSIYTYDILAQSTITSPHY